MSFIGIDFNDPDVWTAFGIIVCLLLLILLAPKFDSTDDSNWGDKQ